MNNNIIFTDGAARGNPGPGGWGAIILSEDKVAELGGGEEHTTNNRMELMAVIAALESVPDIREMTIYTDSSYVVSGITRWVQGWQKNKWKTSKKEEVINRDLWERLLIAAAHRIIDWQLIRGHAGTPANERCDRIATAFADGKKPVLYSGSRGRYGIPVSISDFIPAKKEKSKAKAYSYVSLVDGEVKTHKTWEETEKRVKGVSKAKFKKALSPADEEEIVKEFLQMR